MKIKIIITCLVALFALNVSFAQTNLARGKRVTQSSFHPSAPGNAKRAVDGNTNGAWSANSVTHTDKETQPWLEIDLGAVYDINKVKVFNRTDDCCQNRIEGVQILVKNNPNDKGKLFGVISYTKGMSPVIVKTGKAKGRYIMLLRISTYPVHLSVAEVQVYGSSAGSTTAKVGFTPVAGKNYTLNSPFTKYDITNKNGTGKADMGTKPYNQWKFEKVETNVYRLKEVKSGKYLHIQNQGLEVGSIQSNWWSAMWELEHVSGEYYRIKCKWNKYGKPIYLQNPQRSLTIGELSNKSAKYGQWRIRSTGNNVVTTNQEDKPITEKILDEVTGLFTTSPNEYKVDIDVCHSDYNSTGTKNTITVEFYSKSKLVTTKKINLDIACMPIVGPFGNAVSIQSNYDITAVRIKTNGYDALFIDQVKLYKGGQLKGHHGRDNGGGWTLSRDPNDGRDWKGPGAKSYYDFQYGVK